MSPFTVDCVQVAVLLKAAVVFVLLAADVAGVTEAACGRATREENSIHVHKLYSKDCKLVQAPKACDPLVCLKFKGV